VSCHWSAGNMLCLRSEPDVLPLHQLVLALWLLTT
jgi:hypothetical protein